MFAYLRDMQPRPTTLKKAYLLLLSKWRETEAACAIGVQVGMIFPTDPTKLQHHDSKIGGPDNTGAKRSRGDASSSSSQGPSAKEAQDAICNRCGNKGHKTKSCNRDSSDMERFINDDPNTEYANSKAWQNVLSQWPQSNRIPKMPQQASHLSIRWPTQYIRE